MIKIMYMKLKFIITRLYIISFTISLNTIYGTCSCKTEVENNKSSSESTKKTHITKTLNNPKYTPTKPKPTYTNPKYNSTNPKPTSTNPLSVCQMLRHAMGIAMPDFYNRYCCRYDKAFIPTENNPGNKLPDLKKNVDPEENKKNKLIVNLYYEYINIKQILQYFFKREIQSILDLNITSIDSIKNIIDNNGIEYAEKSLKLLQKFENEVTYDESTNTKRNINYSEIEKESIYALLSALYKSTLIVSNYQGIDPYATYNISNLIQYITDNDNKDNFYNIVPFVSNRSDFFYNLCKSISDAGNLAGMKSNEYLQSWGIGFDCDILNPMYETFCKNCGSNKNDNENKIINYFSIKFYNDNREIKNNFDDDTDNKTVIDFIKYWKLDEGN